MTNQGIKNILTKLEQDNIVYLQFDNYNDQDDNPYQEDYVDLFNSLVVDRLFKHFKINPQINSTIVEAFEYDLDYKSWSIIFYEPDTIVQVDDLLKRHYSQYNLFRRYAR